MGNSISSVTPSLTHSVVMSATNQSLPRLSFVTALAARYVSTKRSALDCAALFKPRALAKKISTYKSRGQLQKEEGLGPIMLQQTSKTEQGASELAINAVENLLGIKLIGEYGEGRFQNLKRIVDDQTARMEVTTKIESEAIARKIVFSGVKGEKEDTDVLLEEVSAPTFTKGTEIKVVKKLTAEEKAQLYECLVNRLRYVKNVAIYVNKILINDLSNAGEKRIDITIDNEGYIVRDNGQGMSAEILVKNYLAISNTSRTQRKAYSDSAYPPGYYLKERTQDNVEKDTHGRVSFLLCEVEIQGVPAQKINIEENVGFEMGEGLERGEGTEKVFFKEQEACQIKKIVEKVLAMQDERKWSILNSLVAGLDGVEFVNGEKQTLIDWIYRETKKSVEAEEKNAEVVFVPNEKAFVALQTTARKIYLDRRLYDFNAKKAGLAEYKGYDSQNGHLMYVADFTDDAVVYVEAGKAVVVNRKYADNKLMLNQCFTAKYDGGDGLRLGWKVKARLPWEAKAKMADKAVCANQLLDVGNRQEEALTTMEAADELQEKALQKSEIASSEDETSLNYLIATGMERGEAYRTLAILQIRMEEAKKIFPEETADLSLENVVRDLVKRDANHRPEVKIVEGSLFIVSHNSSYSFSSVLSVRDHLIRKIGEGSGYTITLQKDSNSTVSLISDDRIIFLDRKTLNLAKTEPIAGLSCNEKCLYFIGGRIFKITNIHLEVVENGKFSPISVPNNSNCRVFVHNRDTYVVVEFEQNHSSLYRIKNDLSLVPILEAKTIYPKVVGDELFVSYIPYVPEKETKGFFARLEKDSLNNPISSQNTPYFGVYSLRNGRRFLIGEEDKNKYNIQEFIADNSLRPIFSGTYNLFEASVVNGRLLIIAREPDSDSYHLLELVDNKVETLFVWNLNGYAPIPIIYQVGEKYL